jgi:hypothetical protein
MVLPPVVRVITKTHLVMQNLVWLKRKDKQKENQNNNRNMIAIEL